MSHAHLKRTVTDEDLQKLIAHEEAEAEESKKRACGTFDATNVPDSTEGVNAPTSAALDTFTFEFHELPPNAKMAFFITCDEGWEINISGGMHCMKFEDFQSAMAQAFGAILNDVARKEQTKPRIATANAVDIKHFGVPRP